MEVVPTSDGDEDDGVIWFRCPQCQGFLPKLSGGDEKDEQNGQSDDGGGAETPAAVASLPDDDAMPWDSPADMMAAQKSTPVPEASPASPFLPEDDDGSGDGKSGKADSPAKAPDGSSDTPEPLHEYAAMLADMDMGNTAPYRPWETYEVGQCLHHRAWEDCGVVVAKEELPGGRKVIKCYFEDAGVVRLIEQAPQ